MSVLSCVLLYGVLLCAVLISYLPIVDIHGGQETSNEISRQYSSIFLQQPVLQVFIQRDG